MFPSPDAWRGTLGRLAPRIGAGLAGREIRCELTVHLDHMAVGPAAKRHAGGAHIALPCACALRLRGSRSNGLRRRATSRGARL